MSKREQKALNLLSQFQLHIAIQFMHGRGNFIQHTVTDTKCKWQEAVVVKQFPQSHANPNPMAVIAYNYISTITLHDCLYSCATRVCGGPYSAWLTKPTICNWWYMQLRWTPCHFTFPHQRRAYGWALSHFDCLSTILGSCVDIGYNVTVGVCLPKGAVVRKVLLFTFDLHWITKLGNCPQPRVEILCLPFSSIFNPIQAIIL